MNNADYLIDLQNTLSEIYNSITSNYFDAAVTGSNDSFEASSKAQYEYELILSQSSVYSKLKEAATDSKLTAIQRRVASVLLDESTSKQVDTKLLKEIIDLQTEIEKEYTSFRAIVDELSLSDNEIEKKLATSSVSSEVQKHWESSKKIGSQVAASVVELVKLRNISAKELGYENYHSMQLKLNEIEPDWLEATFEELDTLTKPTFEKMKKEIDTHIAQKFTIDIEDLKPWHYGNRFFQEPPAIYESGIDQVYDKAPIHEITKTFYDSIGLNIDTVSEKSDLYERQGKNQHAFCIDIDRTIGDIRVLCNIIPSHRWMDTDLHEFGHAAYDYYMNRELPWALMTPSHIFTTESIAMLFGRLASNVDWIRDNVPNAEKHDDDGLSQSETAMAQIVFSRWAQVMYRFEKAMYANPDQDLQKLWWGLVTKYQGITMPAGRGGQADWASKIHIATVPCYYHNYLLGEIMASQLQNFICTNISDLRRQGKWKGDTKVGEYLKEKIFQPGKLLRWDELIQKATGGNLTSKYYAQEFC